MRPQGTHHFYRFTDKGIAVGQPKNFDVKVWRAAHVLFLNGSEEMS